MVDMPRNNQNGHSKITFTPPSASACWAALAGDTGSAVLVVDTQGRFVYSNHSAAQMLGAAPDDVLGKSFADFFPPEVAQERSQVVARVMNATRPVVMDGLLRGRWTRCSLRPCRTESGPVVMLVFSSATCLGRTAVSADTEVIKAVHEDAGPLSELTARETEILKLIGQGLSTAEIASTLHRSVKTIEWHRVSLGNKLGQTNRVGLARVAILAGLTKLDGATPLQARSGSV